MLILTEASTVPDTDHVTDGPLQYRRPLSVLSKLSIQPGRRIVNMPAPTLTNCVGNIGLDSTLPRVLRVPKESVLETFFSQFYSAFILSSSELERPTASH